jgi:hypothetical protein
VKTIGAGAILVLGMAAVGGCVHAQTLVPETQHMTIRVGRPLITLGPAATLPDTPYSSISLTTGGYRGFLSGGGDVYRVEGADPWSVGGAQTLMLTGQSSTYGSCGLWMNGEKLNVGSSYFGIVHAETSCDYANNGQTHKSMALATSGDQGATWSLVGQIITGSEPPTTGMPTGEGDCTWVNDTDYLYAYCLNTVDYGLFVARAPISSPIPGQWLKYFSGAWSEPGLGGQSSTLKYVNVDGSVTDLHLGSGSVSTSANFGLTMLLNNDSVQGSRSGITIAFSSDHLSFTKLAQPILVTDGQEWVRNSSSHDLVAYPSAISYGGGNQWPDRFLLTYMYVAPGEPFTRRYLVFRDVSIQLNNQAYDGSQAQVGVELSRWVNTASSPQEIWTTTAPVPGNYSTFSYKGGLGYVLTGPLTGGNAATTVELEECTSMWPGNIDHLITLDGTCITAGYKRLRTIGWIYATNLPNSVPLYRCWSQNLYRSHFISNQADCEELGTMEFLLGYAAAM